MLDLFYWLSYNDNIKLKGRKTNEEICKNTFIDAYFCNDFYKL